MENDTLTTETGKRGLADTLGVTKSIAVFLKPYKYSFFLGMLALVFSSVTVMAFPFLLSMLTDLAQGKPLTIVSPSTGEVWFSVASRGELALILFGLILLQSIFSFTRVYLFAQVNERVLADIRSALYNKIVSLNVHFFEKNRVGDLTSRIASDVSKLEEALSMTLAEFFRQMLTLIIGLIIIFWISPQLTGYIILVVPVLVGIAIPFGKYIKKISKNVQTALADTNVIVDETLHTINIVKAYTNEQFESNRYRKAINKVMNLALRNAIYRGLFISFIILTIFGALVFLLWKATGYVESGEMTIGILLSFITYSVFIAGSVGGMGELTSKLISTVGSADRIVQILNQASETQLETIQAEKFKGDIRFENIEFTYPSRPDLPIFQGLNFEIAAGQTVALVGPSGAGKSTIVQLLLQYYSIDKGDIKIDNRSIRSMDIQMARANMAIVPQEVILFGGSIEENIRYGKLNASKEEVIEAAKKANALEFIEKFPEGFQTIVGERGVKLSGGQRQRIAIARAILKNPSILLLDEATSALDSESEKLVQDALDTLLKGRTTIVIAHRLSTIRNADKILVIQHGKIVEEGNHEELSLKSDGLYQNLLKLQYQTNG